MSNKQPNISFIVPVYNAGVYLACCIESLLAQTDPDFEILLIDDGSTDGSAAACDAFAERDARIRSVHQQNAGVSVARNCGIAMAAGTWLCFVDADDWVTPDYAALVGEYGHTVDFLLFGYAEAADTTKCLPDTVPRPLDKTALRDVQKGILNRYYKGKIDYLAYHVTGPCAKAYSRQLVQQNDLIFPEKIISGEDSLFNFCFLNKAQTGLLIPQIVYKYRKNDASATNRYQPALQESYLRLVPLYEQAFEEGQGREEYEPQWRAFLLSRVMFISLQDHCHPGNPASYTTRRRAFMQTCKESAFMPGMRYDAMENFSMAKRIVCLLILEHCFGALCFANIVENAIKRTKKVERDTWYEDCNGASL